MKETVSDTAAPLNFHMIEIGWSLPIIKLSCDQSRLKNSEDPFITADYIFVDLDNEFSKFVSILFL